MIYDPITRQQVDIIGRYPPVDTCHKFGKKLKAAAGTYFQFVKVRYGEQIPGARGGFPVGTERDVDVIYLVADEGSREISKTVDAAPLLPE